MNLHTAVRYHELLRDRLLAEFPELREDQTALADTLDGVSDLDEAIAAVVRSMDDDLMMVNGIEERAQDLAARSARYEQRIVTKRKLVAEAMEAAGKRKIVAPDFTLSLTPLKAKVLITDEALIPDFYKVTPEPSAPRPDKKLLAEDLAECGPVSGATLSNGGFSITLRKK